MGLVTTSSKLNFYSKNIQDVFVKLRNRNKYDELISLKIYKTYVDQLGQFSTKVDSIGKIIEILSDFGSKRCLS